MRSILRKAGPDSDAGAIVFSLPASARGGLRSAGGELNFNVCIEPWRFATALCAGCNLFADMVKIAENDGEETMKQRTYLAIDLKSFYASVECRERGLDPLNTNLVVADESRTDKTICLAVTPTLKSYGISGRGRLFEVRQRVREVNAWRQARAPGRTLTGSSHQFSELQRDPALAVDFVIAPPRMAYYMEYSTRIYEIYRKYIAPEDIGRLFHRRGFSRCDGLSL